MDTRAAWITKKRVILSGAKNHSVHRRFFVTAFQDDTFLIVCIQVTSFLSPGILSMTQLIPSGMNRKHR